MQLALAVKHQGREKADAAATMHSFSYFGAHVLLCIGPARKQLRYIYIYIGSYFSSCNIVEED